MSDRITEGPIEDASEVWKVWTWTGKDIPWYDLSDRWHRPYRITWCLQNGFTGKIRKTEGPERSNGCSGTVRDRCIAERRRNTTQLSLGTLSKGISIPEIEEERYERYPESSFRKTPGPK